MKNQLDELQEKFEINLQRIYFCNLIHFKRWKTLRRVYGLEMLLACLSHFESEGKGEEVKEIKQEFVNAASFNVAAHLFIQSDN